MKCLLLFCCFFALLFLTYFFECSLKLSKSGEGLAKKIADSLIELNNAIALLPPTDRRQKQIQTNLLREQFMSTLTQFQNQQRELMERQRQLVEQSEEMVHQHGYDDDYYDYEGQNKRNKFPTAQQKQQQQQMLDSAEMDRAMMEDRQRELQRLEGDIVNVNQIFKDMAALVYEQNAAISIIEDKIETTATRVEEGNVQLKEASKWQSAARKKKCICFAIVLAVLVVIGLIVFLAVYFK